MSSNIKKKINLIFVYSDTFTLEIFQATMLLFVNSVQLMFLDCFHKPVFIGLGAFSILLGIGFGYSTLQYNLSGRLRFARYYWAFCLTIIFLIIFTPAKIDIPIICSYAIQSFASLFIVWRLSMEHVLKRNK